ncbi:hypothetical protein AT959_05215 [Dechloromonas denitrificans]|uniref:Secretion system X translation initiation factor n=1 Tax=Dechloromonas denitrificans TaxID=281362 RepID=A0A133XLD1_9RHOO|nr:hypothetical protein [Dechloromonas denitrificans]KXB31753.1 hypothetical protein AT959_05215 [Dechloromonas denitrificans]
MRPRQRWAILGTLLAVTLGAGLLLEDEEGVVPAIEAATRQRPLDVEPVAQPMLEPLAKIPNPEGMAGEEAGPAIDPFRRKSWYVAPPPPPPAKPKAPPLPFQYLGQLHEDGEQRVFINHQGRHLVIKAGDVIGGMYVVETLTAGQVVFVYLPLGEKQTLPTGVL